MATEPLPTIGIRHVLLVDDHAPTLAAVATLLESEQPGIEVVGTASNSASALRLVRDAAPDVVVLDLDLAGEDGLELIPVMVLKHGVSVIILTCSDDPQKKKQSFSAGAMAFISKYSPAKELIAAIRTALPREMRMGDLSCATPTLIPKK